MRPLAAIALALAAAGVSAARAEVPQAVLDAENARIAAMDKANDAVLAVFASSGRGGGSGVVIAPDGYALTNYHVVKPCGNAMKCGMADGNVYDAVLVGIDPVGDVALIKLFGRDDFPCAELGDSDQVEAGDWAFAMGNPFLLATDFQPTVTYGIVSGVHRYQYPAGTLLEYADCIQTDASINPGNSGGPLFDAQGRLIGINGRGSFEKRGRVNVGVGYAISINQIKNFLGCLRAGRIVDHATLGAVVTNDEDGRVVVADILENSDAYRRGLRYDDEIVSFGGRPIFTPNGFKNALGIYPKDWRVPLSFRRDGVRNDIFVRLMGVHSEEELLQKLEGRQPKIIPGPIPKPKIKIKPPGWKPKPDGQPGEETPKEDGESPKDEGGTPKEKAETPKKDNDAPKDEGEKPKEDGDAPKEESEKPKEEPDTPDEQPSQGEDDRDDSDQSEPEPKEHPVPIPMPPGDRQKIKLPHMQAPMPKVCKEHFEEKRGFANYYYNKQHRQRVWDAWLARGDWRELTGPWIVAGDLDDGSKFRFELTDTGGTCDIGGQKSSFNTKDEFGFVLPPRGSGGLLPALLLWRRLALQGPETFGDLYYYGTMPVPGGWPDQKADMLVGVHTGLQCHFLFDPEEGHLVAVELFADDESDPCEVLFSDFKQREADGRFQPHRMEVRHQDAVYGVFQLEPIEASKAAEE